MKWRTARRTEVAELLRFLTREEWGCVPVTTKLREEGGLPSGGDRVYVARSESDDAIAAVLVTSQNGLVFPVFDAHRIEAQDVKMPRGYSAARVYSIMGRDAFVRAIERAIPHPFSYRIEYYLMTLDGPVRSSVVDADIHVRTAGLDDIEGVFPLQKRYEREEVLLPNHRLNASMCYRHLKKILTEQLVVVAEIGNSVVAKANTNSRGYRYDQVGGVFTEPSFRGRGIAGALMVRLSSMIREQDKRVCLFVKKDNQPALTLYRRLGFETRDDFTITYYT